MQLSFQICGELLFTSRPLCLLPTPKTYFYLNNFNGHRDPFIYFFKVTCIFDLEFEQQWPIPMSLSGVLIEDVLKIVYSTGIPLTLRKNLMHTSYRQLARRYFDCLVILHKYF